MKNLYLTILITWISCQLNGQQNNTLFLMHNLPQSNIVNPAVPIDCKVYVGLPVVGSTHINVFSTGFALNDLLVSSNGDSLRWDVGNTLNRFGNKELIATEIHFSLLSAGYRYRENYITFSVNEKVNTFAILNRDALLLIHGGNTQFAGKHVRMDGMRGNAVHYREYALGWARQMNEKLSLGFRFNLLFGKANVYSEPSNIGLYTDPLTFDTYLNASVNAYASLPLNVTIDSKGQLYEVERNNDISASDYLLNRSNKGFGVDFGFVYQMNEKTTISGSLLDIGYINWDKDAYHLKGSVAIDITGKSFDEGLGNMSEIRDSIENTFISHVNEESYLSPLVPAMYLGVSRELNHWMNIGAVFHSELYRSKLHPSLTFSGNASIVKNVYGSLSYSIQNRQYNNIGAGIGAKFGIFHFHAISDNIPAFFNLMAAKNVNLRFGVSMLFGCDERIKRFKNDNGVRALPCYNDPYSRTKRKPNRKKR